jgi:hypothetical protein
VLVPSLDAYADLWTPFFTLFWRYWPDCPFPVYLGTNALPFPDPRVTVVHAEHGNNWTNRVRLQLQQLQTPYVLIVLEDFFLRSPVDTRACLDCFAAMRTLDAHMVRLHPDPKPDHPVPGFPLLGSIDARAPYRACAQIAIWKRETLLSLMKENESVWEFELLGSRRSDKLDGFFSTWKPLMKHRHVMERGKWFRNEARIHRKMGIGFNSQRPVWSVRDTLKRQGKVAVSKLLRVIPWRERAKLVRFARAAAGLPPSRVYSTEAATFDSRLNDHT